MYLNLILEESFSSTMDFQKESKWFPYQLKPKQLSRSKKKVETEAGLLWGHYEKTGLTVKDNNANRSRRQNRNGRINMRWIDSIKEAMALRWQVLTTDVHDMTFWRLLTHRITMSWTCLNTTLSRHNLVSAQWVLSISWKGFRSEILLLLSHTVPFHGFAVWS